MAMSQPAANHLSIALVANDQALDDLRSEWNLLSGDVPFRQHEWMATWWRHYRQSHQDLFILAVRDEQLRLVGLAPLFRTKTVLQGRILRFLGSGEVSSDYLTILAAEGWHAPVIEQITRYLEGEASREWDLIELTGVDQADHTIEQLTQRFEEAGQTVHRRSKLNCWRLSLPEQWETYLQGLSKSRRPHLRKMYREGFETGRAIARKVQTAADLDRGMEILVDLHQRRRQSLGDPGCFASARFTAFHREVMALLLRRGQLRLHWIELDGKPVAVDYNVVGGDTIYFYQSGIDPDAIAEKPGWLSRIHSIKSAIEEGYKNFDFLRGDEPYKASCRAEPSASMEIRIVNSQPVARLRHAAWRAGVRAKQWRKASAPIAVEA